MWQRTEVGLAWGGPSPAFLETTVTHRYKVIAADPHSAIVALVDDTGRCYIGRATTTAPRPGLVLVGEPPAVGLRVLRIIEGGDPCPVSLAVIGCDPAIAVLVVTGVPAGQAGN